MSELAKLTVSVPKDLILLADKVAKERKISRSKVIANCLRDLERNQKSNAMAEGYQTLSGENLATARMAEHAVREAAPEWK